MVPVSSRDIDVTQNLLYKHKQLLKKTLCFVVLIVNENNKPDLTVYSKRTYIKKDVLKVRLGDDICIGKAASIFLCS